MAGDHHAPPLPDNAADDGDHLRPPAWIEARGGLVKQQVARLQHQRPGDCHPFFLPMAEALDRLLAKPLGIDEGQRLIHPAGDLLFRHPEVTQAKSDIAVDIGIEDLLIRILKHRRHLLAQRQQTALAVIQRLSLPQHRPLLRAQQAAQVHKQRRLSAAVGPHQAGHRMAGKIQRQPFKYRLILIAKPEIGCGKHTYP